MRIFLPHPGQNAQTIPIHIAPVPNLPRLFQPGNLDLLGNHAIACAEDNQTVLHLRKDIAIDFILREEHPAKIHLQAGQLFCRYHQFLHSANGFVLIQRPQIDVRCRCLLLPMKLPAQILKAAPLHLRMQRIKDCRHQPAMRFHKFGIHIGNIQFPQITIRPIALRKILRQLPNTIRQILFL